MNDKVFVNYIYDSCYSLEYDDWYLVFDYTKGILDIPKSKDVVFFVTSKGENSYTDEIFNFLDMDKVSYLLNIDIRAIRHEENIIYLDKDELGMKALKKLYKSPKVNLLGPGDIISLISGGRTLEIKSFSLDSKSLGYLLEIESLLVFFAGSVDLEKINEVTFENLLYELSDRQVDIIFFPIPPVEKNINSYLKRLINESGCQIFFPCKLAGREEASKSFKEKFSNADVDIRAIKRTNERIEIDLTYN